MSNPLSTFKIGCDPEVFVRERATGRIISAHDLIPGSKKEPFKVTGGAVQPDGLAAEFNMNPVPIEDFKAFNEGVLGVMHQLKTMVGDKYQLVIEPSVQFDKDYYDSLPDSAKELGCEPDYCAYSDDPFKPNDRPNGDTGLRSAAGHIHFGWGADIPADHPDHINVCRSFIRQLDWYVGLAMTVMDTDSRRRELYGKAGAFRPKSYGVEYRTPSNVWLKAPSHRRTIHRLCGMAIRDMMNGKVAEQTYGLEAQTIINTGNKQRAIELLKAYHGITVVELANPEA